MPLRGLWTTSRQVSALADCDPFVNPENSQLKTFMKKQIQFLILTGWLIPVGVALVFFGRWITEIVVPTLKGGNFDQLYDLHQVRYLDTILACTVIAFAWATVAVFRYARSQITITR
jgi:hypothetical protein